MPVLKLAKVFIVRMLCGREFHNFDAECEKERSYNAERDLGIHKAPFSCDLRENE